MTLDEYIAKVNSLAFWREFTYYRNKFSPYPGSELELADSVVWLGRYAFIIQAKERKSGTFDEMLEQKWFNKKVLGRATKQIRDSLSYIRNFMPITLINERGHKFDITAISDAEIHKIVLYSTQYALPDSCRLVRYHISETAGFIHIIKVSDYLTILSTIRAPEDIRRYLCYREKLCFDIYENKRFISENEIIYRFLCGGEAAKTEFGGELRTLQLDYDSFDISPLISNLHEHIEKTSNPYDYYQIMKEFANLPRSVWREIKLRLTLSLNEAKNQQFTQPYRIAYPSTNCAFVITPAHPNLAVTGADGEINRIRAVTNLTSAAMYDTKMPKGIGIMISRDGAYFQIDWCFRESPWRMDPVIEQMLRANNPFRKAQSKLI